MINLLASKYSDKNNQSDSHVKSGGEKNDELESSSISSVISILNSPIQGEKSSNLNSLNSKSNLLELILPVTLTNEVLIGDTEGMVKLLDFPIITDKLLSSIFTYLIILFLLIIIILIIIVKKLWNT